MSNALTKIADDIKGDMFAKQQADPVHWVILETGEIPCRNPGPSDRVSSDVNAITCLGCRRALLGSAAVFGKRYEWGRW